MILLSTIELSPIVTFSTALVTILLPFYFVWTFQRISFGAFSNYLPQLYQDTNIKEFHILFPLLFLTIFFGVIPSHLLRKHCYLFIYPIIYILTFWRK